MAFISAASVVVPLLVVYASVLLARRERGRPRRSGLPVRNGYIAACAAAIVLAVIGGAFAIYLDR